MTPCQKKTCQKKRIIVFLKPIDAARFVVIAHSLGTTKLKCFIANVTLCQCVLKTLLGVGGLGVRDE